MSPITCPFFLTHLVVNCSSIIYAPAHSITRLINCADRSNLCDVTSASHVWLIVCKREHHIPCAECKRASCVGREQPYCFHEPTNNDGLSSKHTKLALQLLPKIMALHVRLPTAHTRHLDATWLSCLFPVVNKVIKRFPLLATWIWYVITWVTFKN